MKVRELKRKSLMVETGGRGDADFRPWSPRARAAEINLLYRADS